MKQPGNIAGMMRNAYPERIEADYRQELVRRPSAAGALVMARVMRAIDEAKAEYAAKLQRERELGLRADAELPYDPQRAIVLVQRALAGAKIGYTSAYGDVATEAILQRARAVDAIATRIQVEIAESVPGIKTTGDPSSSFILQQSWAKENAGLIKSVDEDFFNKVTEEVLAAVSEGKGTDTLAKAIQDRTGAAESRAAFIARDQIAKLNGKVVQARQQGLGVKRYRWRTVGDERVRDTHRAHDGKIFLWSEPPPGTGHPGHDFNCRCFAEPIFDDEMLDDSPDDPPEMRAAQQEAERRVAERAAARARKQAEQAALEARQAQIDAERRVAFLRELERQVRQEQAAAALRAEQQRAAFVARIEQEARTQLAAKPGEVQIPGGGLVQLSEDGQSVTLTLPNGRTRIVSFADA